MPKIYFYIYSNIFHIYRNNKYENKLLISTQYEKL